MTTKTNTLEEKKMETIKAKRVNCFEKAERGYNRAQVTVKVKNKVYDITMDYRKPYNEDDYIVETNIPSSISDTFAELDIEVDYSDIEAEYVTVAKIWIKEKEEARIIEVKENYKNLWAHSIKKEIEELDDEVTTTVVSEKDFIDSNRRSCIMSISYNGYTTEISYEDISRRHYGDENMKYIIDGSITNYKRKGYKKISSLVKKLKELVNKDITQKKEKRESEKKNNNLEQFLKGIEIDGCVVKVENSYYRNYKSQYIPCGFKLNISWEQGYFSSTTSDGKTFCTPTLNERVNLETFKRYTAHVKSFS